MSGLVKPSAICEVQLDFNVFDFPMEDEVGNGTGGTYIVAEQCRHIDQILMKLTEERSELEDFYDAFGNCTIFDFCR